MGKNVLIILPYLKNGDGTAVALMNYYYSLIEGGWSVDFLNIKTNQCAWVDEVKGNLGKVFELPDVSKYSQAVKKRIEHIITLGNYDIIHVNVPGHLGSTSLKIAKNKGIKLRIFHAHNPRNTLNLKTIISTKIYDKLIINQATHLIACSEYAGVSRFGNKKFIVLKNVIEPERFQYYPEAREKIRKDLNIADKVVVGVVGRLAPQKNPYFLVHCFAEFKKIEPNAFLLWIGEGKLQNSVKRMLNKHGLSKDYCLAGRKNDVEKWYSAMDLFLLPSVFEGMGIVFLEAQCTGLPCLGSNNVPKDTEVTDLMHRLDLRIQAKEWASEMKNILNKIESRRTRTQEFIDAGYTHEKTKDDLKNYYERIAGLRRD